MHYTTLEQIAEVILYPAGESHLRLRSNPAVDLGTIDTVEAAASSFEDLGQIITADRILRRLGHSVEWFLPYFPFARHDRRNDKFDGFELGIAIDMVTELDLVIADPHSDVAGQLRHFDQRSVVDCFRRAGLFDNDPVVVIPDAGAAKKTYSWLAGQPVVQASKHRDPASGELSGFDVHADNLDGRPCIIVDDICDGGGTFLGLAKKLQIANAGTLTLAVTHGVFSKGAERLAEAFSTIACLSPTVVAGGSALEATPIDGVATIPFHDLYMKGSIT